MALLAVILCVNLTACSDDDDEDGDKIWTLVELVGTKWHGTDPDGYIVDVTVKTASTVEVAVSGYGYEGTSTHSFSYDETSGTFTFVYDGVDCAGRIRGNSMSVSLDGYTMNLTRR